MLGIFNARESLRKELSNRFDLHLFSKDQKRGFFPKLGGLFIDWSEGPPEIFALQAALMDYYAKKKIPIVVFDRFMAITQKEFEWSKKFNVHFFEPAIRNRQGFEYLPQWIEKPELPVENEEAEIDFLYSGDLKDKLPSFEKYYLELAKTNPNMKIFYIAEDLPKDKVLEYHYSGVHMLGILDWSKVAFTIAIDSLKNYTIGYLDPVIFDAMENGCMPIIPIEHRFFGSMFEKLVISKISDLEFITCFREIRSIIISDIYDNIIKYYPEFTLDYFEETIKEYFE